MKKRLLSIVLCVIMTVALLPSFANAEEGKVIELTDAERPEDLTYVTLDENSFPLSNEELETAYLETLLYGKSDQINNSARFVPDPDLVLSPAEYAIEQYVKQEIIRIANGERTSTEFNISLANMGFTSADYSEVNLSDCVSVLMRDCTAELYWFARYFSYGGSGPSFYICLYVSDAYSNGSDTAVDASKIASARAAIANANSIVSKYTGYSDADKLYAYRDEICALVEYNNNYGSYDPSSNPNPWEIVWAFDGNTSTDVVCEGYSKAFEYLCDLSSFQSPFVNCYCVSGSVAWSNGGGGPHMWNIVTMDDGRNYLVDVTNCDGWSNPNVRFLKHAVSGSVSNGYKIDTNDLYPYDSDTRVAFTESALTLSTQAYTGPVSGMTPTPKPSATPTPTAPPESEVLQVGSNYVTVPAGETVYRPFTPTKDAYYSICSTGNFDTYGILTDSNQNTLMSDDDSGSDYNFKLMRNLTAGTTYYVGVRFYSPNDSGTVSIVIEETENPYPGYLEFDTNTIYGKAISSDIVKDYDLVFVNFWAEWCGPCVGEMPDLEQLHQDYPNVLFLGVWVGSSMSDAKNKLSELGVTYPIIEPDGTLIGYDRQIQYIPSTFFFDKNGKQVGDLIYIGSNSYDGWKAIIDDLLAQYGDPEVTLVQNGTVEWNTNDVQFKGATAYVIANGKAQTPRFTVKDDNGNVVSPVYYDYEYRENTNAGTGYVIVTFKGAYSGTAQGWFKIYLPATKKTTVENVTEGIRITWAPVEGAAGYVIYRRAWSTTTNGWTSFERWWNVTGTSWIDGSDQNHKVYAGTRYQYGVKAYFERRYDPIAGTEIGGNVNEPSGNYNLGIVGPLKTTVRITTRELKSVEAGSKKLTAKWGPSRNFTGYELQYATDANFTQNVRTVGIEQKDNIVSSYTVTGLTSGKTYYVRVRSYHEFEGFTYYGEWSNVLNCKVK